MELLSGANQGSSFLTAKEKLRKAKNNFLRLRKTSDAPYIYRVRKNKRAVRRDIVAIDDELGRELKEL